MIADNEQQHTERSNEESFKNPSMSKPVAPLDKPKIDPDLLSTSNIDKVMTHSSLPLSTPNNFLNFTGNEDQQTTGKSGKFNFGKTGISGVGSTKAERGLSKKQRSGLIDTSDLIASCLQTDSRYLKTMKKFVKENQVNRNLAHAVQPKNDKVTLVVFDKRGRTPEIHRTGLPSSQH